MSRQKKRPAASNATREARPKKNNALRVVPWGLTVLTVGIAVLVLNHRSSQVPNRSSTGRTPTGGETVATPGVALSDEVVTNVPPEIDLDEAAHHLNRGNKLLAEGKLDEAIAEYRQAVRRLPEDEDMHYNLALALAKKGNREEAKKEYLEALRIYPDYAEAHNNLGNILLAEHKLDQAIEHFQAAIKISPEDASAHNNLGHALALQGKADEAIKLFKEAVRLKPDYIEALSNLASAELTKGLIEEAIPKYLKVLESRPDFLPAQRGLKKARELQINKSSPAIPTNNGSAIVR